MKRWFFSKCFPVVVLGAAIFGCTQPEPVQPSDDPIVIIEEPKDELSLLCPPISKISIVFARCSSDDNLASASHVFALDAANNPLQITSDLANNETPIWFPRSDAVIDVASPGRLQVYCLGDTVCKQLFPCDSSAVYSSPSVTSDGKQVCYLRRDRHGTRSMIEVYHRDTKTVMQFPSDIPTPIEPQISPDGRYIAFVSEQVEGIFVTKTKNGETERYYEGLHCRAPAFDSASIRMVFSTRPTENADGTQIWLVIVENGVYFQITKDLGVEDMEPEYSPDGRSLVFSRRVLGGADTFHLYTCRLDGSSVTQLTFGNTDDRDPSWR